ncbi:MAG: hypothetical protein KDB23_22060 [Planctomycetales bacterium]|nr:hypothetical protein [Planctomycetales bacterium]
MRRLLIALVLLCVSFVGQAAAQFQTARSIINRYEISPIDNQGRGTLTLTLTGSSPNCFTQDFTVEASGDELHVRLYEPSVFVCNYDLRYFTLSVDFRVTEPPKQIFVHRLVTSDGLRSDNVLKVQGDPYLLLDREAVPGDANFDGVFDSADFLSVFRAGQYSDQIAQNSTWFTGDWNGDFEFDSADLVAAFQTGAYVGDPVTPVTQVPEPTCGIVWLPLIIGLLGRKRAQFAERR